MKKMFLVLLALALFAGAAVAAQMDNRLFTMPALTDTAAVTNAYTLRGSLEAVRVIVPAGCTGDVAITSAEGTLFTKSAVAASATFYPRVALHSTAGAAITFLAGTNNTANAWYDKAPMAGAITTVITGASVTTSKVWQVNLIYSK